MIKLSFISVLRNNLILFNKVFVFKRAIRVYKSDCTTHLWGANNNMSVSYCLDKVNSIDYMKKYLIL